MGHCKGCWLLAGIHVAAGVFALVTGHAEGVYGLASAGVYGLMARGRE